MLPNGENKKERKFEVSTLYEQKNVTI